MPDVTPGQVKQARHNAGLSRTEAAKLVYATYRTWQNWETGDRSMHYGLYELFLLKTGQKNIEDL